MLPWIVFCVSRWPSTTTRDAGYKIEHRFSDHYVKTEFPCAIVDDCSVLFHPVQSGIRVGTIFQPFLPSFSSRRLSFRSHFRPSKRRNEVSGHSTARALRASNLSWHEIEIEYARHLRRLDGLASLPTRITLASVGRRKGRTTATHEASNACRHRGRVQGTREGTSERKLTLETIGEGGACMH